MSFHGWNTNWVIMRGMRCYSCLFQVKTSSKEEGILRSVLPLELRRSYSDLSRHKDAKTAFIVEFS